MGVSEFVKHLKHHSSLFEEVIKVSRQLLYHHPIAEPTLKYLSSRLSKSSQDKYEFGYFPSDEYLDVLLSMVDKDKLYSLHLLYNKYVADADFTTQITCGSLAEHNLIMPYRDAYGNILALVGRSLRSEEDRKNLGIPKYKNTTFTKTLQLFGFNGAKKHIIEQDYVIVVEGQIDCITANAHGIRNIVALGGVAFSTYQFCMLNRYTNNIYLALDNDDEGKNSAKKIIKRYGGIANVKSIEFPSEYKDLDILLSSVSSNMFLDRFLDKENNGKI